MTKSMWLDVLAFVLMLIIFIGSCAIISNIATAEQDRHCKEQYGSESEHGAPSRSCIIKDGTLRYLR